MYKEKYKNSKEVPDMDIPPELCLELLMAADFLNGKLLRVVLYYQCLTCGSVIGSQCRASCLETVWSSFRASDDTGIPHAHYQLQVQAKCASAASGTLIAVTSVHGSSLHPFSHYGA